MAYAVQATTHYQTYLERPPGADLSPKKVCNLDPMAPRSRLRSFSHKREAVETSIPAALTEYLKQLSER